MQKALILTVAVLTVLSCKSEAMIRPYASAKLAYTDLKIDNGVSDDNEDGISFSVSYGASFNTIRTEFELSRVSVDFKYEYSDASYIVREKDTLTNTSFMVNTFMDIPTKSIVIPYLGVGIGVGVNSVDVGLSVYDSSDTYLGKISADATKSKFTYQAMAGIAFELDRNFDFDVGYKYVNYGNIEGLKASANNISVGIRYNF
ncbi:porin family protein [bacterium]|nr:porin family protein [bacterium]